jgi:transposase
MKPITYSAEYRANAVKMVTEQGLTMAAAAKQLDVNYHSLRYWIKQARLGSKVPLLAPTLTPEQRIRDLEKENARLRMEREILKKATAFFAKEHP